jgi:hypothetical protein
MITVDTLRKCSWLDSATLESLIRKNYPKDRVVKAEFVGITNGGQFAYNVGYPDDESKSGMSFCKMYVWLDSDGKFVADY